MVALDYPQQATLDVINPVTQAVIGSIPRTTADEVAQAIAKARIAQNEWASLPVKERGQYLRRWMDLLWQKQDEGMAIVRRENGKTTGSAYLEFMLIQNVGQYLIHQAKHILKPKRRRSLFPGIQSAKVFYKPHGVVGIITPWNYPFAIPFVDMMPAVMAGNAVLFKPSEITPYVVEWGVNLMVEAGFPQNLVQVVQGGGETGQALVEQVDFIQFTGSTATGRKVAATAANRLIPYSLELGGKDPAIVLNDADPAMTAIGLLQGAFENCGQMCISIERVYVEEGIYDELLENLKQYASDLTMGTDAGLDVVVGSMTNEAEFNRTKDHIEDALGKGARILTGGNPRPDLGPLFFEPTILTDVDHNMAIMQEETFGPVMPIMKVKNADEAVQLANDSIYGLSASIFSRNLKQAENLARQIDTGDVNVNRAQYATGTPSLPTGGQRESGTGRRNGPEGLLKYTTSQAILLDNLRGAEKSLVILTPTVLFLMKTMRAIRRHIAFI